MVNKTLVKQVAVATLAAVLAALIAPRINQRIAKKGGE